MASQKSPIYCVAAHFCSFGTPYVWPHSQKHPAPCISALLLRHPVTFYETIKRKIRKNSLMKNISIKILVVDDELFIQDLLRS
ncbi:MAG: hypothetical protein Q8J76_09210, partial [Desulfobulbaceae bacterium]|nr:hypothetical protein [Desulfobulbaceae bacterium]